MHSRRIDEWNARYRAGEQVFQDPAPLVVEFARDLTPGVALDLACGPGRNSVYLAERGWRVTAVDGSSVAIELLRQRDPAVDARVADLEAGEFTLEPASFHLVLSCYYLQRDLIPAMKAALKPGGALILIAHLADPDQPDGTPTRAYPGELRPLFKDWRLLHYREGEPGERTHRRSVLELVAQKPA